MNRMFTLPGSQFSVRVHVRFGVRGSGFEPANSPPPSVSTNPEHPEHRTQNPNMNTNMNTNRELRTENNEP